MTALIGCCAINATHSEDLPQEPAIHRSITRGVVNANAVGWSTKSVSKFTSQFRIGEAGSHRLATGTYLQFGSAVALKYVIPFPSNKREAMTFVVHEKKNGFFHFRMILDEKKLGSQVPGFMVMAYPKQPEGQAARGVEASEQPIQVT